MKTLNDHIIIYDDDCPMCNFYTGVFIKTKMLEPHGRIAFSELDGTLFQGIDKQRACDEIALVDTRNKTITYGLDSLYKVIGHRFPPLCIMFKNLLFCLFMSKIYKFISLNRKVIAPGKSFEANGSCIPDFNYTYRWVYIGIAWLVISVILTEYAKLLESMIGETHNYREYAICAGQMLFQGAFMTVLQKDRILHYLGNLMTISFGGAILLLPMFLLNRYGLVVNDLIFTGWFMVTAGLMLLEHIRRARILNIHWSISFTWVLYRVLVLSYILIIPS